MDDIDRAQELQMLDTSAALAAHQRRARADSAPPSTECVDCGAPLPPARIAIGACRCIEHQRDHEQRCRQGGS